MRSQIRAAITLGAVLALGILAAAALGAHSPVTLCHKPGTPAEHTITVDDSAVPAHLAHGDEKQLQFIVIESERLVGHGLSVTPVKDRKPAQPCRRATARGLRSFARRSTA